MRRWGGFNCWAKKTFEQTSATCRVCVTRCVRVCVCVRVDKLNNWQLFGKFYELIISHIILLLDSYCNGSKFALFLPSLSLSPSQDMHMLTLSIYSIYPHNILYIHIGQMHTTFTIYWNLSILALPLCGGLWTGWRAP